MCSCEICWALNISKRRARTSPECRTLCGGVNARLILATD